LGVWGPCLSVSWPRVSRQRMLTSGTSTIHALSGGLVSTASLLVWNLEADGWVWAHCWVLRDRITVLDVVRGWGLPSGPGFRFREPFRTVVCGVGVGWWGLPVVV